MNILEKIIAHKKPLLEERKKNIPVKKLTQSEFYNRDTISLKQSLIQQGKSGIIAEFKRRSPSKPAINLSADVLDVTTGYEKNGASALSILTDSHFFGGKNDDIEQVRSKINIPILRKDFIFDYYQVYEAKSMGADAILLIAEVLEKKQLLRLATLAKILGLEVLMEIHSEEQLEKLNDQIDLVGVNNRNLKTFEVSIENSLNLVSKIPENFIKISESGLRNANDILILKSFGYKGFLIGESFMKNDYPALALANFVKEIKSINN